MSEDYARRYFAFCKTTTAETIGKTVNVVLAKRQYEKDGEKRTIEYVKYLNLLDENGNPIIMVNSDASEIGL
jgi:hypothetical protein